MFGFACPQLQEAYGDQRLWSAVGWGAMALVAGKLVDPRSKAVLMWGREY